MALVGVAWVLAPYRRETANARQRIHLRLSR